MQKTDALTDAFESLNLDFACITETWFKGGRELKEMLSDIEGASGIRFVHKSRDGRRRSAGGGVAVAYNPSTCNFKQKRITDGLGKHEIVCAFGKVVGMRRPVAIYTVYIPPRTTVPERRTIAEALAAEVAALCSKERNPAIFIGGDFNHAVVIDALMEVGDFTEISTGPTRGENTLDIIYTNMGSDIREARTLPPLRANSGADSDHRCVYAECKLGQAKNFHWVVKMSRRRTEAREEAFANELKTWGLDANLPGNVDCMALVLEQKIAELTEKHFPMRRDRRRSNEDPWITRGIRRLWKRKLRIYKKAGRSEAWWDTDARLQRAIDESKEAYVERLLDNGGNSRSFYAATKRLASATNCKEWKVADLFPEKNPEQVGTAVLDYFGKISVAEAPQLPDVPRVEGGLPRFTDANVAKILRESKKTDSMVEGDPLPHLVRRFPEAFARPVGAIFNEINASGKWPKAWKTEFLTIIPKVPNPASLTECRNISCTSVFSKILEGQVLQKLRSELIPDPSQYGGKPKCGVEHMLIDLWEKVLSAMEGGSNAAVLLGIDYEKAFNRMEHAVCLDQLKKLGASPGSIALVRAFLEDRQMTITIEGHKATPVSIRRGSPQGSVLGCLLYCVTTQTLTSGLGRPANPARQTVYFPQDGPDDDRVEMWDTGGDRVAMNPVEAFLYVDDTTLVDVVPMQGATRHISTATTVENFSDLRLEGTFEELERRATEIGMAINKKKTQLLVVSPPNGCNTVATMKMGDHEVSSQKELKLVGFTFCDKPGASAHVAQIKEKFRVRVWMLYHLRRSGFRRRQLYRLYCCYLRTIIEYCSVVYHSILSCGQREDLERIHRQAIRICYGHDIVVGAVMAEEHIETLEARRVRRCDTFIKKSAVNPTFASRRFRARPETSHSLRRRRTIFETRAGTNRWFNSPLSFLRRRANQLGIAAPASID